jgi:hypothetical protein
MKASIGDRIVVARAVLGAPVRDGAVIEVRDPHGNPPFLVRWTDSGRESLLFPGPDAHIDHVAPGQGAELAGDLADRPASPPAQAGAAHVKTWRVDVYLYENGADTAAHAVLHTGEATHLDSRGEAKRSPHDSPVPEIGDEIAAARALRRLADRLLGVAYDDLDALEEHIIDPHV